MVPRTPLDLTENSQPAILAASIALYRAWTAAARPPSACPTPAYFAGHSMGQYSAMVAAGCWSSRMRCASSAPAAG